MHTLISSPQNQQVKNLLQLEKPRERRRRGLFIIEGKKELALALGAGYQLVNLFFCEALISPEEVRAMGVNPGILVPVTPEVFGKIARRENSGGVVAVAALKVHRLDDLSLPEKNPLVLVLENVEKPGNLGALLRTADAASVSAVIVCDQQTDFYNANVIRSSIGTVFTVPIAAAEANETAEWLNKHQINIYSTNLNAAKPYYEIDFRGPSAIVMGTESTGLSDFWIKRATSNIIIPMEGKIDSMNVSTAAAVLIFEARRQRIFSAK